jgi:hypothetical protein
MTVSSRLSAEVDLFRSPKELRLGKFCGNNDRTIVPVCSGSNDRVTCEKKAIRPVRITASTIFTGWAGILVEIRGQNRLVGMAPMRTAPVIATPWYRFTKRFSGAFLHAPRGHATKARRNPIAGMAMAPWLSIEVRQNASDPSNLDWNCMLAAVASLQESRIVANPATSRQV